MSNHVVTTKIEAAFPTIEDVVIEIGERWIGQTDAPIVTYGKTNVPRSIPCSCSPAMHDGIVIDQLLMQMVSAKRRELTVRRLCQGVRHIIPGHVRCSHWFNCHIQITYKKS